MGPQPHSAAWYDRLATLQTGYQYPWQSRLGAWNGEAAYLALERQAARAARLGGRRHPPLGARANRRPPRAERPGAREFMDIRRPGGLPQSCGTLPLARLGLSPPRSASV